MNTLRTFKYALPVAPILLVVAAALAIGPTGPSQSAHVPSASQSKTAADGSQADLPQVTVNGEAVPVVPNGTTQFNTGDAHATVSTSQSDSTTPGSTSTTTSPNGSMSISVSSNNTQGSSSSFTMLNSSNFSSNSGQHNSSVQVFSNGTGEVHVSQ